MQGLRAARVDENACRPVRVVTTCPIVVLRFAHQGRARANVTKQGGRAKRMNGRDAPRAGVTKQSKLLDLKMFFVALS